MGFRSAEGSTFSCDHRLLRQPGGMVDPERDNREVRCVRCGSKRLYLVRDLERWAEEHAEGVFDGR